jgi:hypothetical protein
MGALKVSEIVQHRYVRSSNFVLGALSFVLGALSLVVS